jgi:hypothetical protein
MLYFDGGFYGAVSSSARLSLASMIYPQQPEAVVDDLKFFL